MCTFQGEQYKLIWPEQSEFVRMAARFGAKIVPFGVAGEDDFGEVSLERFIIFSYCFSLGLFLCRPFTGLIFSHSQNLFKT